MNLNVLQQNACGGCTACCYAIGVEELGKPYFQHCKHQKASSCKIHETKPESCRKYRCLYLQGEFGQNLDTRPDNLGFVFQCYQQDGTDGEKKMVLEIIEIEDAPRAKWHQMSEIFSRILGSYKIDAVKLFCWDTTVATRFHTTPIDTFVDNNDPNWHPWKIIHKKNFPPLCLWLRSKNPKTLHKILTLASNGVMVRRPIEPSI
jgi:hypothetical protein